MHDVTNFYEEGEVEFWNEFQTLLEERWLLDVPAGVVLDDGAW
mgnify:CR=1 FL=1